MTHVTNAIKVHERADCGYHKEECASQRVHADPHAEGQIARGDPGEEFAGCAVLSELSQQCWDRQAHGECPCGHNCEEGNQVRRLAKSPPHRRGEEEAAEWEQEEKRRVLRKLRDRLATL